MASFYPDRAAELAMQSDSDESLLDNKSCSDSYSSSEPNDVDSDDSSDDVNLPTTRHWLHKGHVAEEPRQGLGTTMFGMQRRGSHTWRVLPVTQVQRPWLTLLTWKIV